MEKYQYTPLDTKEACIRLIYLHKGQFGDPVYCSMFDALSSEKEGSISDVPYDALSYTWKMPAAQTPDPIYSGRFHERMLDDSLEGRYDRQRHIFVDSKSLDVTQNLHDALRHLRYEDQDRVLWVDAICIDQGNLQERNHQVAQMKRVYQYAESVIIWLGARLSLAEVAIDAWNRYLKLAEKGEKIDLKAYLDQGDSALAISIDELQKGFELILAAAWFDRVWILQEVAFARAAAIQCGEASISTTKFLKALEVIQVDIKRHCKEVLSIMPSRRRHESSWWKTDRSISLLQVLKRFGRCDASDPKDRIIALLGLTTEKSQDVAGLVDYGATESTLVERTLSHLFPHFARSKTLPYVWKIDTFFEEIGTLEILVSNQSVGGHSTDAAMIQLDTILQGSLDPVTDSFVDQRTPKYSSETFESSCCRHLAYIMHSTSELDRRVPVEFYVLLDQTKKLAGWYNPISGKDESVCPSFMLLYFMTSYLDQDPKQSNLAKSLLFTRKQIRAGIERSAAIELQTWGSHMLNDAACWGSGLIVDELLSQVPNLDLNFGGPGGFTALGWASKKGYDDIVHRILQEDQSSISMTNVGGTNPLESAVLSCHVKVVKILLKSEKARRLIGNKSLEETVLHLAVSQGNYGPDNEACVEALLDTQEGRSAMSIRDKDGMTPLTLAARIGAMAEVKLLLQATGSPKDTQLKNESDLRGRSTLAVAIDHKQKYVVKLLLQYPEVRQEAESLLSPTINTRIEDLSEAELADWLMSRPCSADRSVNSVNSVEKEEAPKRKRRRVAS